MTFIASDSNKPTPNPIVKTTKLRAYSAWTVREYTDGTFDGVAGVAVTPGFDAFPEVVNFIRAQEATSA